MGRKPSSYTRAKRIVETRMAPLAQVARGRQSQTKRPPGPAGTYRKIVRQFDTLLEMAVDICEKRNHHPRDFEAISDYLNQCPHLRFFLELGTASEPVWPFFHANDISDTLAIVEWFDCFFKPQYHCIFVQNTLRDGLTKFWDNYTRKQNWSGGHTLEDIAFHGFGWTEQNLRLRMKADHNYSIAIQPDENNPRQFRGKKLWKIHRKEIEKLPGNAKYPSRGRTRRIVEK